MMFSVPPDEYPPIIHSDTSIPSAKVTGISNDDLITGRHSSASEVAYYSTVSSDGTTRTSCVSGDSSPYELSPWNQAGPGSPFSKSPWSTHHASSEDTNPFAPSSDDSVSFAPPTCLVGSLVREEGHIYSLAAIGELLYTGSDSKNIRVWKNQEEFAGFKSNSGLVKAIVISGDHRIFTGHQDGKIRVWKVSAKNPACHKRAGTLPKLRDYLMMSFKPSNYVEVRRNKNALWIKHHDAVSCLCLSEDHALLYSGSWDKTFKVWRISDSKCLESVNAHDDAVNAVVAGFDGLVFTGSADGTVKVWRREVASGGGGKGTTRHAAVQTLLTQESAVTALAVNKDASVLYCGSSDGLVNFWEREKHLDHGGILRGHKLAVLCLAAAGALVLSGSADKNICIWRREGGAHSCLSVLSGHTGPVKCLAVETDPESKPEDTRWVVYSGSLDKSVKVWKVSELAHDMMIRQYQGNPTSATGSSAADHSHSSQPSSFSSPNLLG